MSDRRLPPRAWDRAARVQEALTRFFFAPADARPLAVLRIGVAAVLLAQAVTIAPAFFALYDRAGFLQGRLEAALAKPGLPRLDALVDLLDPSGASSTTILVGIAAVYVLSLGALLLGFRARLSAAVAWLGHMTLMTTANAVTYGVDVFAHVFLFYLVWLPSGAALSVDRRRRAPAMPTWGARLGLRVVQLQLCIVYLASGLGKAAGRDWWNGTAMWQALMMPDFRRLDFSWLAGHRWVAVLAGWTVLLVEIGDPVLVWPRRTRRLWVTATVGLHLGIMAFMGLHLFGAIMIVLTVAAFAVDAEPRATPARASRE